MEESDRRCRFLVGEHLGVGQAAVVVDGDVDVLPASNAAVVAVGVASARLAGVGEPEADTLARTADATELLDVDVHELARPRALVALRWLETEPAKATHAGLVSTADTVECGIDSVSAISAAVIRNCRSLAITATRSADVRLATCLGADERSYNPRSPPAR